MLFAPEESRSNDLYHQLSAEHLDFRLLDLQASLEYDSEIRCQLRQLSLNHLLEAQSHDTFEALSYTWGDASSTEDIYVNDQVLTVTANLASFLRHRRETERVVTLWVDAVCINQKDTKEKQYQVPIMNMIYGACSKLTIWLGTASEDSSLAIETLVSLGATTPYSKLPMLPREAVSAIQSFFQRPWWTRVWIIQELAIGGLGPKIPSVSIHCGKDRLAWVDLVMAAARIKSHQDDQRQDLPNIDNVLELESLRESAVEFLTDSSMAALTPDLICRYRHFMATDPKDKVYAVSNMFTGPFKVLETRYDCPVEDVYFDYALGTISKDRTLDIIRHCGASQYEVPSWVPDWSVSLDCHPLPYRSIRRYWSVPWWAVPEATEIVDPLRSDGTKPRSSVSYHFPIHPREKDVAKRGKQHRLQRLEQEAKATEDETLAVQNPLAQGELITERRVKNWLLNEITDTAPNTPLQAAASTEADFVIDKEERTLISKGIVWDAIETVHEPFVSDIEKDWKDTVRFMVSIGQCKALASANSRAVARYASLTQLLEAFWSTLLAGQWSSPTSAMGYMDWLPEVPASWVPATPRVTSLKSGRAEAIAMKDAWEHVYQPASRPYTVDFDPALIEAAAAERAADGFEEDLAEVPLLLSEQPYDLHHGPFTLANIVPDPYWEYRDDENLPNRRKGGNHLSTTSGPIYSHDDGNGTSKRFDGIMSEYMAEFGTELNKLSHGILEPGAEKYTLGRRFFITEKGYFGLGPKDAKPGDNVAVLFGIGVPFVLRQLKTNSQVQEWTLVGESYVHGIMDGEAMGEWTNGDIEAESIVIR